MTVVERIVAAPTAPARRDWPALLAELAELADHLNQGRLYSRDLPNLTQALDQVLSAYRRATR